jgi:hypothetical protein
MADLDDLANVVQNQSSYSARQRRRRRKATQSTTLIVGGIIIMVGSLVLAAVGFPRAAVGVSGTIGIICLLIGIIIKVIATGVSEGRRR